MITIREIFDSEIRHEDTQLLEYGTTLYITLLDVVDGYRFKGWSDGVAGSEREIFVIGEATYDAIYEKIPPPEITSFHMLYSNKQISAANKLTAGDFLRIVVGAQWLMTVKQRRSNMYKIIQTVSLYLAIFAMTVIAIIKGVQELA